jgi:hypothetical protein
VGSIFLHERGDGFERMKKIISLSKINGLVILNDKINQFLAVDL